MKNRQYKLKNRNWIVYLLIGVLGAGCGIGDDPLRPDAASGRQLNGNVSKGPLNGATIRVYEIDARGQRQGPVLAETTTNAAGDWSLSLAVGADYLVVESSGGVYVDEADPDPQQDQRRTIQLAAGDSFSALLPADATTVAINIYTDALLRKSRAETQGADFFAVYEYNRSFVNAAFGFDITTTQPADPIAPDAGAPARSRSYAMALGGVANAVNALAIENQMPVGSFQVISALIDDLTDCMIDGNSVAGPVQGVSTMTINLNDEILRFRNNNFNAYQGTPLLVIDQSECARSGRLGDTTAPEFAGLPGDFIVEAPDDQGIASGVSVVQNRLQAIEAVDDRDGPVSVANDLPGFLPVGDTVVSFAASDLAGNTRTVTLTITVRLPQAPVIVAPPDVVARVTGPLTPVYLGLPQVSDNVSGPAELVVENDAPAAGFRPGVHQVQWTVTDEAGLRAQDVQEVIVGSEQDFGPAVVDPGYTLLPVLPDPDEPPIPPVDSDFDRVSDGLEILLGTDPYDADTDRDGVPDGIETELVTGALFWSTVVRIPATGRPGTRRFSFAGAEAGKPAFVVYEPGLHSGRVELVTPCDHVVLIGNASPTGDPVLQARIGGGSGRALTVRGCQDVRLFRMEFSDSTEGGIDLIDSQAAIYQSVFYRNSAIRGAAIQLTRSDLTVERSILQANVAATDGGAIWIGLGSTASLTHSVLSDNYAMRIDVDHGGRLMLFNVSYDPFAIASQSTPR